MFNDRGLNFSVCSWYTEKKMFAVLLITIVTICYIIFFSPPLQFPLNKKLIVLLRLRVALPLKQTTMALYVHNSTHAHRGENAAGNEAYKSETKNIITIPTHSSQNNEGNKNSWQPLTGSSGTPSEEGQKL